MTGVSPMPLLDDPMPPWRLWLDPRGRIDRATFWLHGVLGLLGMALLLRALLEIARWPPQQVDEWVGLLLTWPLIAISAKRWHDRDRSGWWVLVLLLPLVGVLWLLADNEAGVAHDHVGLEVQQQRQRVDVGAAHGGPVVVDQGHLGMQEGRRVLEDAHAVGAQLVVQRTRRQRRCGSRPCPAAAGAPARRARRLAQARRNARPG
jgi:uncharacterized membrane protein YhaH (DUF805 family)